MPPFLGLLRHTLSTMSQQGSYSVAFVTINKMEEAKKLAAQEKNSPDPSLPSLFPFTYSSTYMNLFFDISNIDLLENLILKEIPLEEILTIIVIDSLLPTLII